MISTSDATLNAANDEFDESEFATPWPDGPSREIDDVFRKVVLHGKAMIDLFKLRPTIASEVVLAILIKAPKRIDRFIHYDAKKTSGINDQNGWLPPLYIQGPFLSFLFVNFTEGLNLIVKLVEFAALSGCGIPSTVENQDDIIEPVQQISLLFEDGPRNFIGDERLFGWSAGMGQAPYAIVTALMALEQYFYFQIEWKLDVSAEVTAILNRSRNVAFLGVLCDIAKYHEALFLDALKPLLSTPEIFTWDIRKNVQGRSHLGIGAPMQGEPFWRMAQAFHNQAHRKLDLIELARNLLCNKKTMSDYFVRVLAEWQNMPLVEGDVGRIRQALTSCLNLANYEVRYDPTHGIVLVNTVAVPANSVDDSLLADSHVITLPIRCREIFNAGQLIDDDKLDVLWRHWQQVRTKAKNPPEQSFLSMAVGDEYANAIAGCIALFVWHKDWRDKDESRLDEIATALEELIRNPPARDVDLDDVLADWSWECFAAEAIAILWVEFPDSTDLRQLVVETIFTYKQRAIACLFSQCAKARASLGDDFQRLRRLAFEWAFVQTRVDLLRHFHQQHLQLNEEEIAKVRGELDTWAFEKCNAFTTATSLGMPQDWRECDETTRFQALDTARQNWRGYKAMNFRVVRCSHEWLPLPDDALDEKEREDVIQFWRAAVSTIVERPNIDLTRSNDQHPDEDESWVLQKIGGVILQLRENEHAEQLWQPILDLHSEGHLWPEMLANSIHINALSAEKIPNTYVTLIRAMLKHALFDVAGKRRWSRYKTVWDALIGVDRISPHLWRTQHVAVVRHLQDVLAMWMQCVPQYDHRLARFATWLTLPAAAQIRPQAIEWLVQFVQNGGDKQIRDLSRAEDAIAGLLNVVWSEDESLLRRNPAAFSAFKLLLDWLGAAQNRLGLELLGRIGNF